MQELEHPSIGDAAEVGSQQAPRRDWRLATDEQAPSRAQVLLVPWPGLDQGRGGRISTSRLRARG
jgi:hypothetical protein